MQNVLVFLVEAYFKLVLDYSSEISHCEVDFHNIYIKLHWVSTEIQATPYSIGNEPQHITHFNSPNTDLYLNTSSLPPMSITNDLGMDIQRGVPPATNSEARGRNPSLSAYSSRESSLASSGRATPYHDRMDVDVALRTNESNSESLELSYETTQEQAIRVSMAANQQVN